MGLNDQVGRPWFSDIRVFDDDDDDDDDDDVGVLHDCLCHGAIWFLHLLTLWA